MRKKKRLNLKNKSYFLSVFLLFILSFSTLAAIDLDKQIRVRQNKLPIEFSLLVQSYQNYSLKEDERKWFQETITKLDNNLSLLTREETFFVIKTEIYKSLLLDRKKTKLYLKDVNPALLDELKEKIQTYESSDQSTNEFTLWYLKALYTDLTSMFNSTFFPELMRRKREGRDIERDEMIALEKKLRVIIPHVKSILRLQSGELTLAMKPTMKETIERIHLYTEHLLLLSRTKLPQEDQTLTFFTTKDPKEEKKIDIEAIIEDVEKKVMADLKPPKMDKKESQIAKTKKKDQWTPKGLPRNYPTPDPYYSPPDRLPDPVGDWGDQVAKKKGPKSFQEIDPNYIPPLHLPKPVNDWLDPEDMAKAPKNLPTPNPNYQAPAKLPEPVEDWLPEEE